MAKISQRNPPPWRDRAPVEAPGFAPRAPLFDVPVHHSGREERVLRLGAEDPTEHTPPPSARRP
jgi:hypothetical protein